MNPCVEIDEPYPFASANGLVYYLKWYLIFTAMNQLERKQAYRRWIIQYRKDFKL